jgi:hypothetical protein
MASGRFHFKETFMTHLPTIALSPWPRSLWISSLILVGMLLTPEFHCGFPLAAFAAIAAVTLDRRDALLLCGGVWLANQALAFGPMHHHMSATAAAWAVAMGAFTLLACETAVQVSRRMNGLLGACAAFAAAFVAYKLSINAFGMAMGSSAGHIGVWLATLPRGFLVGACTFAGLGALYVLGASVGFERKLRIELARHRA